MLAEQGNSEYDGIIPLILRDTFHLGDTLAGAIMALDNVCALFLLPFFGSLSDRCNSRLGRRHRKSQAQRY